MEKIVSDEGMPLSLPRPLLRSSPPISLFVVDDARQDVVLNSDCLVLQFTMPEAGTSKISSGTLLDLKALTAEHKERFEKEGRSAVKGQARNKPISKVGLPLRVVKAIRRRAGKLLAYDI